MAADDKNVLEVLDWGLISFKEAYARQQAFWKERSTGAAPDRLVIVEHPPVVTIGRSGNEHDLCLPEAVYRQKGIEIHSIDRGGKATYHGPAQMVA